MSCAKCGAEIVAGTNFCRSCGKPVESHDLSEAQTAMLAEKVARAATQRFEPRKTAEASMEVPLSTTYNPVTPVLPATEEPTRPGSRRGLIIAVLILLILVGVGSLVSVLKRARHSPTQAHVSQQLTYPAARTILNIGGSGGAVLQMETTDQLTKVSDWYEAALKPATTLRVNAVTVIMKTDTTTVTLAATDTGTTIVIKEVAP